MEEWKLIKETHNRYSISNMGRVKKEEEVIIRNNGRKQLIHSKILTPITNQKGYLKVRCNTELGVVKNIYIHKLVAMYFVDGYKKGLEVNHIDGNKNNNSFDNLEWCTSKENIHHAWKNGLAKPTNNKKIKINNIVFDNTIEASHFLNVSRVTITTSIKKGYYINKRYRVHYKGKYYESLKEAGRKENLSPKTIAKYGKILYPKKHFVTLM